LTDEKLSYYYKNCRALLFPGIEDFGLVMAEAQSFGKPVIAFKGGGAIDIIKEGITGEFFDKQTPNSLKETLAKFKDSGYNSKLCRENAERFSFEKFENDFKRFIDISL
jgi:glycosyltransferase involved in cell wall biosynthesis